MNNLTPLAALLAALAAGLVGIASPDPLPLAPDELLKLPGVASVETYRMSAEPPTRRIIHILNWHFVDPDAWAADLRGQGASDEEIAESYPEHLYEVAAVQVEKAKLLEALIDQHGVRAVYMEGLSAATVDQLQRQLELLRDYRPFVDPGTPLGQLLEAEHHRELLRVGPEGRLAMEGRLVLLPAEDAAAYAAADPRIGDVVKFDEAAQERREDAVVQNLLAGPSVVVVTFGAGHNFYDNIRRVCSRSSTSGLGEGVAGNAVTAIVALDSSVCRTDVCRLFFGLGDASHKRQVRLVQPMVDGQRSRVEELRKHNQKRLLRSSSSLTSPSNTILRRRTGGLHPDRSGHAFPGLGIGVVRCRELVVADRILSRCGTPRRKAGKRCARWNLC